VPLSKLSDAYPTDLSAWQELTAKLDTETTDLQIRDLFQGDPQRFDNYSIQACDLFLDYSKNLIDDKTLSLLVKLATEAAVPDFIDAMFAGKKINSTEGRPVLHTALRATAADNVAPQVEGTGDVAETLAKMSGFVDGVQSGKITGTTDRPFTDIVNIGIGGSDLGVVMATRALRHYWKPGMQVHCVSNVDGTQLSDLSKQIDLEATLFVICSKTFTTAETMANAVAARQWVETSLGKNAINQHFAACSTNHEAMDLFGINQEYRFGFWDWVGGRYSLWSAIGLSLALVVGADQFQALLQGGRRMDQHFRTAPIPENMPILMALISIWYNNFYGAASQAILPYDNRLDRFPAFLQQLHMESSGKSVRRDGKPVQTATGTVIWGEPGSNAQHSFYQLLHQGTRLIPVDFILVKKSSGTQKGQQHLAISSCLAQAEALMDGYEPRMNEPHRRHPGNRPSNVILMPKITPETLGQLIALYEHKVFVENTIWGVNAFDQYGVELGKRLATTVLPAVTGDGEYKNQNLSTRGLLKRIKEML